MLTIHSARLVDTRTHVRKSCKKLNFIGLSECSSPRCHHPSRREKATSSLWCLTLIIVSPWSERDKAFVKLAQVQGPEDLVLLPALQTAPTFSACCLSYPARHNPDTFQQKMHKIREVSGMLVVYKPISWSSNSFSKIPGSWRHTWGFFLSWYFFCKPRVLKTPPVSYPRKMSDSLFPVSNNECFMSLKK